MKRLSDIIISLFILFLMSPIVIIASIFILCEDGLPIFYFQNRVGYEGKTFRMIKLRSMFKKGGGAYFTSQNDPRITKVGKVIRRYSIDELPQLFNVLKGDMSLVGPRPDVPQQRAQYSAEEWALRCSVRPGITGLAQALLRSEGTEADRLQLDLQYIQKQSLLFDLKILAWTALRLTGKGGN